MDTTAAAELGMGIVGGSVNYWDLQAPEEEYDTTELPSDGGENLEYGIPGQDRPLPSGPEPANKRMKMIPGVSQGYADYGDVSGSQYGYWPGGYGGMWDATGMGVQWRGIMSEAYPSGPDMGYGSQVSSGSDSAGGGRGRGAGSIFYKTKLCSNFKLGNCPFDTRCNFAHGMEELRKPPPGWESMMGSQEGERWTRPTSGPTQGAGRGHRGPPDVQKFKTRPCKYFREGNCPYAERCTFLHDSPGNPPPVGNDNVYWSASETAGNVLSGRAPGRPPNWKTRICNQWENTGQCSFAEKCHFAHGAAELQKHGGGPVDASEYGAPKFYLKQIDADASGSSDERLTKDGAYGDWVDEQEQGNGHFSEAAPIYPVGGFGQYPHQYVPYFRPYVYGHYPGQNGIFRKGSNYHAQDDVGYRGEYGQEPGYHGQDDGYDNSYDHQGWNGEY